MLCVTLPEQLGWRGHRPVSHLSKSLSLRLHGIWVSAECVVWVWLWVWVCAVGRGGREVRGHRRNSHHIIYGRSLICLIFVFHVPFFSDEVNLSQFTASQSRWHGHQRDCRCVSCERFHGRCHLSGAPRRPWYAPFFIFYFMRYFAP